MAKKETTSDATQKSSSRVTIDFAGNQMSDSNLSSQENMEAWVREQYQRANKHLAEQGILFDSVVIEDSRYLAPHVAIWKIKDRQGKFYWVISGNVPADAVSASVANNARDAVKHFSLAWQLKADGILGNQQSEQTQQEYANYLIVKAEYLYDLHDKEEWWL